MMVHVALGMNKNGAIDETLCMNEIQQELIVIITTTVQVLCKNRPLQVAMNACRNMV